MPIIWLRYSAIIFSYILFFSTRSVPTQRLGDFLFAQIDISVSEHTLRGWGGHKHDDIRFLQLTTQVVSQLFKFLVCF